MAYISRYNKQGKSVANLLYQGVENGTIRVNQVVEVAKGERLDYFADKYYGDGRNWWIIASANGIRWPLGIGNGFANRENGKETTIKLFIPLLEDVLSLLRE